MVEPIRVLIADDNPRFRRGLRALLESAAEIEAAREASSGAEAVTLADRLQPDVILMDIKMPDLNGIDATRQIVETSPHIGILMLTMVEEDDAVFAAMRAGARGYLLKGTLKAEILRAVRGVSSGEAIFGPAIARRLMDYFASPRSVAGGQVFPELTVREPEVLGLLAQHLTNPEIAARLSLSPKTVRNIASSIFNKLQVADRAEAIVRARDAGLGRNEVYRGCLAVSGAEGLHRLPVPEITCMFPWLSVGPPPPGPCCAAPAVPRPSGASSARSRG